VSVVDSLHGHNHRHNHASQPFPSSCPQCFPLKLAPCVSALDYKSIVTFLDKLNSISEAFIGKIYKQIRTKSGIVIDFLLKSGISAQIARQKSIPSLERGGENYVYTSHAGTIMIRHEKRRTDDRGRAESASEESPGTAEHVAG
jgi:hypothetical protein